MTEQKKTPSEIGYMVNMIAEMISAEQLGWPEAWKQLRTENEQLRQQLAEAQAKAERAVSEAAELRTAITDLVAESRGVDGLHLNGEVATWDWLIDNQWLECLNSTTLAEEHLARDREQIGALRAARQQLDEARQATVQLSLRYGEWQKALCCIAEHPDGDDEPGDGGARRGG